MSFKLNPYTGKFDYYMSVDDLQAQMGVSLTYYLKASNIASTTILESEGYDSETLNATPTDTLSNIYFKTTIADTPTPFTFEAGSNIYFHFNAKVSTVTAVKAVTVQMRLFYVDSDGTSNKTAIAPLSNVSATLTTTKTFYTLMSNVGTEITVPAGKRLWVEVYANTSGAAVGYPDLWIYRDSGYDHITFGVQGSVLASFLKTAGGAMTGSIDMATSTYIGIGSAAGRLVFTDASPDTIGVTTAKLTVDSGIMDTRDAAGPTYVLTWQNAANSGISWAKIGGSSEIRQTSIWQQIGAATYGAILNVISDTTGTIPTTVDLNAADLDLDTGRYVGLGSAKGRLVFTDATQDVLAVTAANLTVAGQYSATKYTTTVTLNWDNGNVQYIVLANGSQTFTFANPLDGGRYCLILKQPSSGAAGTVAWPATVSWPGATAPTLTTTNSQTDVITFVYDGTNTKYFGGYSLNYT